jgi:NTP pyrophosphatase (non-canonical NTP hydrolase)
MPDLSHVSSAALDAEVQRRRCAAGGHDWEIVATNFEPSALVCPCGESRSVTHRAQHPEELVRRFHEHFGLPIGDTSRSTNKLRWELVEQESTELVDALKAFDADPSPQNLCDVAHEGADVLFAVIGTNLTLGIDTDRAAYQVFLSLLTRSHADPDGKVRKGPNYRPPDMRPAIHKRH